MSSMPRLLAASISRRSIARPSLIAVHIAHSLSGSPSCGLRQLSALARILAVLVLPVPRGPQNQVGVGRTPLVDSVAEGARDHLLSDDLAEPRGPPLPVEDLAHPGSPAPVALTGWKDTASPAALLMVVILCTLAAVLGGRSPLPPHRIPYHRVGPRRSLRDSQHDAVFEGLHHRLVVGFHVVVAEQVKYAMHQQRGKLILYGAPRVSRLPGRLGAGHDDLTQGLHLAWGAA